MILLITFAARAAFAAEQPGVSSEPAATQSAPAAHVYDTAAQIQAMARCAATVDERSPCWVRLHTAQGEQIYLGSPGATKEVAAFLPNLKDGRSYTLPDAFLEYLKNQK